MLLSSDVRHFFGKVEKVEFASVPALILPRLDGELEFENLVGDHKPLACRSSRHCRIHKCVLGFTPFSASLLFGLSLVALLIKHPELYPCWLRRVNFKIMFLYELFASLIFIEVGFCLWNSVETFLFYRVPSFLEEHCSYLGDIYIRIVETEVGVSLISNVLALTLLLFTLHITRVCNFNLLLKTNGVHKFFADAGLTSKLCRHHRELRQYQKDSSTIGSAGLNCPVSVGTCMPCRPCIAPKLITNRGPKMLRSGKRFY